MDSTMTKVLRLYEEIKTPQMFLTSLGEAPPENIYKGDNVTLDIIRSSYDMADPVLSISSNSNQNKAEGFTNKTFDGAVYSEGCPIGVNDLTGRQPGQTNYQDPNVMANLLEVSMRQMRILINKIKRNEELQAAQALLSGIIDLKNSSNVTIKYEDFKPKATHRPTISTKWDQASAKIVDDLTSLYEVIANDSGEAPDQIITDPFTVNAMLQNSDFQKRFDLKNADLGQIAVRPVNAAGAVYHGQIVIGSYRLDLWTYNAVYKNNYTGLTTRYIPRGNLIMRSSTGRIDRIYGDIPTIVPTDSRLTSILPQFTVGGPEAGYQFSVNIYAGNDNKTVNLEVGRRYLYIPTAIDTIGAFNATLT